MPTSTSAEPAAADAMPQTSPAVALSDDDNFYFPTETEIYILPNGQVVFADLPVELVDLAEKLGAVDSS